MSDPHPPRDWIGYAFAHRSTAPYVVWMNRDDYTRACRDYGVPPRFTDPGRLCGYPIVLIDQPPAWSVDGVGPFRAVEIPESEIGAF